jgi:hypothetical protein
MSVDYNLITESSTGDIYNIDAGSITQGVAPDTTKPFRNIRIGFESLFNTMCTNLSITHKIYENTDFDLSEVLKTNLNAEWVVGTLLPADTSTASLGTSGTEKHDGLFQIDYYSKTGVGGFTDRVDSIANYFTRGMQITANGTVVRILNVSLGVGRRDGAFFVRNIDVSYYAVTPARS